MTTLNRRAPPRLALWRPEAGEQEVTFLEVVRQLEGALDGTCAAGEDLRHRDSTGINGCGTGTRRVLRRMLPCRGLLPSHPTRKRRPGVPAAASWG